MLNLDFKTVVISITSFIGVHLLLSFFHSQVFVGALDATFQGNLATSTS